MSYTRKAVWGVGTIILLHLVAALLGYGFRFILARKLGVELYGLFYSVLAFFFLFSTVKDLGIGNALVITLPKLWLKKKWDLVKSYIIMTYGFKLAWAAILTICFWISSPWLAEHLFKTNEATYLLRIMSVVFFLGVNEEIFSSMFLGFQKYSYFARIELFKKILLLIFLIAFLNYGLKAPALAFLLTSIILPLTLYRFLKLLFPIEKYRFVFSKKELTALVLLGFPFVVNTLTYSVVSYFDTLLLTSMRSLHEVGLYNAALPTAMTVLYFMYAFDSVIQPLAAELYHSKKKEKLVIGLGLLHKYLLLAVVLVSALIISYAPLLLSTLYGTEFASAGLALQILMIGIICYTMAMMNVSVLSGIGEPKTVAKIMIWAAVTNVVLNLAFIPTFGMIGAAVTTVLSYAIALVLSLIKLNKRLELQLPWKGWVKTLVSGGIILLIGWKLQSLLNLSLWVEVPAVLIVMSVGYALLVFGLRAVSYEEIKMLWREIERR